MIRGRHPSPIGCCLRARPVLSLPDPIDRLVGTGGPLTGAVAHIGDDRVDQPRRRPGPVGQRGTERACDLVAGYPRPGIEAERPSGDPDVVQAFHRGALSDAALPAGPCGTQFGTGGGESLSSFRESRGAECSRSDHRGVQHQQLAAEALDPVPSLRPGIVKPATAERPRRKREGRDNDDEHHRDQQDRSQQDGGHRIDRTPETAVAAGLAAMKGASRRPPRELATNGKEEDKGSYAGLSIAGVPAGVSSAGTGSRNSRTASTRTSPSATSTMPNPWVGREGRTRARRARARQPAAARRVRGPRVPTGPRPAPRRRGPAAGRRRPSATRTWTAPAAGPERYTPRATSRPTTRMSATRCAGIT